MRLRSLERVSRISPLLSTSVKRLTLGSSHHCLSSFFALPVRVLIPGTFTSRPCFPAGWTVGRKFQCRQAEAKAGKNHAHHLHPTSHLSAPRDANQHLQSAVQRNLLVSLEGRSSQAPHTADQGSDARSFAAAEDPAQSSSGSRAGRRVLDARAASPARFDSAFHIYLLV